MTYHTGAADGPTVTPTLTTAPTCGASAYSSSTAAGSSPTISCGGGSNDGAAGTDENYTFNYDATASLSVAKAEPSCSVSGYSVTYDGSAHTATGTCTGVNTETLSGLDLTGTTHTAAGSYPTDPWSFTDATGNYNAASGTVSDAITGGSTGVPGPAQGSGQYRMACVHAPATGASGASPCGQKATFAFDLDRARGAKGPVAYRGPLTWGVAGVWKFTGTVTSVAAPAGATPGTATGTGTLWYWKACGHSASWVRATVGAAQVSIAFTAGAVGHGRTPATAATFAVGFKGTRVAGAPALPSLPAGLASLTRGAITLR